MIEGAKYIVLVVKELNITKLIVWCTKHQDSNIWRAKYVFSFLLRVWWTFGATSKAFNLIIVYFVYEEGTVQTQRLVEVYLSWPRYLVKRERERERYVWWTLNESEMTKL